MRNQKIIISGLVILVTLAVLFTLLPTTSAVSNCPDGFTEYIYPGDPVRDVDRNNNLLICVKPLPSGLVLYIDDILIPEPHIPD